MFKAALFDLDGVVFNTEPQYTVFWGEQCKLYHPEIPGLEEKIKGQTLKQIYDKYFSGSLEKEQAEITQRLNDFEQNMHFDYIAGIETFIADLKSHGVKTAVVTSSNIKKMSVVYRNKRDFKNIFDIILTAEDFTESKPSPQCYLKSAERFGLKPKECIVFEDSFNGLKSGRAADMTVVGLATTNSTEDILPFSDFVINDYRSVDYKKMCDLITSFH